MVSQRHRGPHPDDPRLFGLAALPSLRTAAEDAVWLRNRGYPIDSVIPLVGGRYQLEARQRNAISRALCTDEERERRTARGLPRSAVTGKTVFIDGFNLIITLESALSGGVVLLGRDGCLRDLAGVSGGYHAVSETDSVLGLVGTMLTALAPKRVHWVLDQPISNSGRLKARILEHAETLPFPVEAELQARADAALYEHEAVVSSDSAILDRCASWVNLAGWIVREHVPSAWLVELFPSSLPLTEGATARTRGSPPR